MNITDVDDKIIQAARQQHFLAQYIEKHPQPDQGVIDDARQAYTQYIEKNLPLLPRETATEQYEAHANAQYGHVLAGKSLANDSTKPGDDEAKIKMHLTTAKSAAGALNAHSETVDAQKFYEAVTGVMLPRLDALHKTEIDSSDHSVFNALAKRYEDRFFEDMRNLNVMEPDHVTRVTEYGQQIVDFVEKIQSKGFAYHNQGSVYYDTAKWESSGGTYARLEPWSRNDARLQAEGEGALAAAGSASFGRPASDFALWKKSKPGEPGWPSPWGIGRPGWHIECSAMASDVLGEQMDIHSGGIDLAFPHHDNELAQSEAYWSHSDRCHNKQWVNYFLHMGHLGIAGAKMSKSLKNYTTIRQALQNDGWTSRSLRIAFLLGSWNDKMEITQDHISAGKAWEERLDNLFLKVLDAKRRPLDDAGSATADDALRNELQQAQSDFDAALCDSFDTPSAMRAVSVLLTAYNAKDQQEVVSDETTSLIAQWLKTVIQVFGLDAKANTSQVGWSGVDIAAAAHTYVYPLSTVRDEVRRQAKIGTVDDPVKMSGVDTSMLSKATEDSHARPYQAAWTHFVTELGSLRSMSAPAQQYLALCDRLRDEVLWDLSIYLEDRPPRPDGMLRPAMVRPLNDAMRQERQDRERFQAMKLEKQAAAKAKAEKDEAERLEKGRQSHVEMFRTSEFSDWDADGIPLKNADGSEINKSKSKTLRKTWERQKKLHEAYLAAQKK